MSNYSLDSIRAVGHPVLKAHRVSEAIAGVDEKPTLTRRVSVGVCHEH